MINETRQLRKLYWSSLALRLLLGIGGWLLMQYVSIPLLQDALYYETVGASVAHDWLDGRSSTWLATEGQQPHQPVLMILLIACFYTLTLGVRALPLLLAFYCAITAFTPVLTYRIARQIGASPSAALISGWLVAVSPAFVFWSGALYKEGLVLLILNLAIFHALRLQTAWHTRSFQILSLCLLGLAALRLYLALITAAALCIGLFFGHAKVRRLGAAAPAMVRQALVAVLFVAVAGIVGFAAHVQEVLPTDSEDILDRVRSARHDLTNAPSGYLVDADVSTVQGAVEFFPQGLAYFLTVPLPWQTGSIRQNLAIPDTAVWLLLYPVILLGIFHGLRRNSQGSMMLILITVGLCVFYALLVGNIGTAYRLRVQIWLLWAAFFGIGWEALRPRHRIRANHPMDTCMAKDRRASNEGPVSRGQPVRNHAFPVQTSIGS